jgi:branched-chain amino acid transport system permease protein
MQLLANYVYLIGYSFAIFVLISLGLAVIFGMMRVINLAQGEFIMLGAYVCVERPRPGCRCGLPSSSPAWPVGAFAYRGRTADHPVSLWPHPRHLARDLGPQPLLVGGVTILYGPQSESVGATLGNFQIGDISYSRYSLVVIIVAVVLLVGTYAFWRFTRFGLIVRGTMQNAGMAAAMGINTGLVYMLTFGFGSRTRRVGRWRAGADRGASPQLGVSYIAKAFITVIAGGPLPLLGTSAASALFGTIDGIVSYKSIRSSVKLPFCSIAIVLLRLLPLGSPGGCGAGCNPCGSAFQDSARPASARAAMVAARSIGLDCLMILPRASISRSSSTSQSSSSWRCWRSA